MPPADASPPQGRSICFGPLVCGGSEGPEVSAVVAPEALSSEGGANLGSLATLIGHSAKADLDALSLPGALSAPGAAAGARLRELGLQLDVRLLGTPWDGRLRAIVASFPAAQDAARFDRAPPGWVQQWNPALALIVRPARARREGSSGRCDPHLMLEFNRDSPTMDDLKRRYDALLRGEPVPDALPPVAAVFKDDGGAWRSWYAGIRGGCTF